MVVLELFQASDLFLENKFFGSGNGTGILFSRGAFSGLLESPSFAKTGESTNIALTKATMKDVQVLIFMVLFDIR